ncbi:MAG: glutathione S-transferase family protein [Burkholderiales bacterium]
MIKLFTGNRNYSSWSMRPWVLLKQAGIPFEDVRLRFDSFEAGSAFKREIARVNPAGKVPTLVDSDLGGLAIWDSLAICEYLAEKFRDKRLWPRDARARARARSVCAEMHSGFAALRTHCGMNIEARLPEVGNQLLQRESEVRADVDRVCAILSELLEQHGGPLLFGDFTIADAFFAPVVMRFNTYGLPAPAPVAAYMERVGALAGVRAWVGESLAEREFLSFEENYRSEQEAQALWKQQPGQRGG